MKQRLPAPLPIHDHFEEITALLSTHPVILVAGETGSGKSTQLPQLCHALFQNKPGMIGHTQPRRIAAKTIAARVAEEMKSPLGQCVGYQMRFSETLSENTKIKVMTDGILLAETAHDPLLKRYHTLIIDEAHERSLNIDFILGYLKKILPKRPDLKVIITSATLDYERLAAHFKAPIVKVEGRSFPIHIRYQPLHEKGKENRDVVYSGIVSALFSLQNEARGDVLIFLATERDIREVRRKLSAQFTDYEVLPLYARLPLPSQQKIFHPGRMPRIILATNVAETSITVPNVRYVIDSGTARVSRFNAKLKIQRLPIEAISQANAKQRAGRAGRTALGIVIRLYSEEDFNNRLPFLEPELFRTSLSAVILMMLNLKLGDIRNFPFIDSPPSALVNEGYKELLALEALDETRQHLTEIGREMSRLPLDPRLARMLIAAREFRVLPEVLIIVSHLTIQDPRAYPEECLEKAKAAHARYAHPESEFLTMIRLWEVVHAETNGFSNNQFKRYCEVHYLSLVRMREWQALHHELLHILTSLRGSQGVIPQSLCDSSLNKGAEAVYAYRVIHQALLTGGLYFVGVYDDEKRVYRGAENKLFQIFPGSSLAKKKFKWLMAESLMETHKVYARIVARIEPNWLEPISRHLVKKQYSEPCYDRGMDEVIAYETVLLYGLPIITRRKTLFAKKNPVLAREVFIREGLIPTQNQAEMALLENWEAKLRRLGLTFREEEVFAFYIQHLPDTVVSFKSMESPPPPFDIRARLLDLQPYEKSYPDALTLHGQEYTLTYLFEPGDPNDGVTLHIPLHDLPKLHEPIQHPHAEVELKFLVENAEGKALARSTSLTALKRHFASTLDTLANTHASPFGETLYTHWTFGDLQDAIEQAYPALTPKAEGVQIKLYHEKDEAEKLHIEGVLTLARIAYARELKALKSESSVQTELGKLSFIQDKVKLTDAFLHYALFSFFTDKDIDLRLIRTAAQFNELLDLRPQFYAHHLLLKKWLDSLTAPLLAIRIQLKSLSHKQGLAASVADLQHQFVNLCLPHFFKETPLPFLRRYPIYLKGMQLRIERLLNNPEREMKLFRELESVQNDKPELRWIMEEYRISLFAQELKTLMPISTKKILAQLY